MRRLSTDVVVIGSGWGGATAAWSLSQAGVDVTIVEQGTAEPLKGYRDRGLIPLRDQRNFVTFRPDGNARARPFTRGWSGVGVGGGSRLWGGWAFRPTYPDFHLRTIFELAGEMERLSAEGYLLSDWPLELQSFDAHLSQAEALLGVAGDSPALKRAFENAMWRHSLEKQLGASATGLLDANATRPFPFPAPPLSSVGDLYAAALATAGHHVAPASLAICCGADNSARGFADGEIFSKCRKCKGLYYPSHHPGRARALSLLYHGSPSELRPNIQIESHTKAIEILFDRGRERATGVRCIKYADHDGSAHEMEIEADIVVLACGAIHTARLLFLSKGWRPDVALGNQSGWLGRGATFHIFGLWANVAFPFNALPESVPCVGPTGSATSFDLYFAKDDDRWLKGGINVGLEFFSEELWRGASQSDPLECPFGRVEREIHGNDIALEFLVFGDDLPSDRSFVDLDPHYVDMDGCPVARVTRSFGPHEQRYCHLVRQQLKDMLKGAAANANITTSGGRVDVLGDHQMGTCRMGHNPKTSVVDTTCRLHEAENVFIVDGSTFPSGLGVNPTLTIVANALRVGDHILTKRGVN